jgi:hypothetical protein
MTGEPKRRLALLIGTAALLFAAILTLLWIPTPEAYTAVFTGASLVFLLFAWIVSRAALRPRYTLALLLAAVALRAAFLGSTPIGSDDVYRYLWDGKVQAAGIDPYRYPPDDPALVHLHSDRLPALVNHPDLRTLYFPLTQWIFYAAFVLSGEALLGIKMILLIAETLTILALALMAGKYAGGSRYALLYVLCPLPILQFALDGHIDAIGIAFLAWGLLRYLDGKKGWSYLLIGLSLSVKPVALVMLPLLFLQERGAKRRIAAVLVPLLVFGMQFVPYLFSQGLFDALFTFTRHWVFNGALFELINAAVADNQRTRVICAITLTALLGLLYLSRLPLSRQLSFSVLLLLLCSPVVHPWYVAWLAVLIPLAQSPSAVVYAATVSLASFTVLTYAGSGVWRQYPLAMLAEYLPVALVFVRELRVRKP